MTHCKSTPAGGWSESLALALCAPTWDRLLRLCAAECYPINVVLGAALWWRT